MAKHLALFYCDLLQARQQNGGADVEFRRPVAAPWNLPCRATCQPAQARRRRPRPDQLTDVVTNHVPEFGLPCNGMFSDGRNTQLSAGTSTARAFVEVPSLIQRALGHLPPIFASLRQALQDRLLRLPRTRWLGSESRNFHKAYDMPTLAASRTRHAVALFFL